MRLSNKIIATVGLIARLSGSRFVASDGLV